MTINVTCQGQSHFFYTAYKTPLICLPLCSPFLSPNKSLVPFYRRQNLCFSKGHALFNMVATSYLNIWLFRLKSIQIKQNKKHGSSVSLETFRVFSCHMGLVAIIRNSTHMGLPHHGKLYWAVQQF